ncbi:Ubiquitin-conjugating enzyme E2 T [Blyttiomyces sp. JEL0837]|nr:Ubiquitin-conjugating enzyme E2 T [Blyttiomyces sp. JEL0837]
MATAMTSAPSILTSRMKKELQLLSLEPPFGVTCWPSDENMLILHAELQGPETSPYAQGAFKLEVRVPERYPFEPPQVQFRTPIYHPNIDSSGRICSDVLKLPPKGNWKPGLNINIALGAIRMLLLEPNPDDPLENDIAEEFKHKHETYAAKAKSWTLRHAVPSKLAGGLVTASAESLSSTTSSSSLSTRDANSKSTSGGGGLFAMDAEEPYKNNDDTRDLKADVNTSTSANERTSTSAGSNSHASTSGSSIGGTSSTSLGSFGIPNALKLAGNSSKRLKSLAGKPLTKKSKAS